MKHHKLVYLLAFSFLLTLFLGVPTLAQSVYPIYGQIRDHQGNVVPAATVIILSGNLTTVNTATQPGSPLATIYSDPAGTMVINQLTNPVTTSGTGQFVAYAATGSYVVQAYRNNYQLVSPFYITTNGTGCTVGGGMGQVVFNTGTGTCTQDSAFTFNSSTKNLSVPSVNKVVQLDGVQYATLSAALTAACNGSAPGKVVIPPGTYQLSATVPSSCTLEGAGKEKTILQATATQSTSVLTVSGSNIIVRDLSVDGNRASNTNSFDAFAVNSASYITIENVNVHDSNSNGLTINGASSYVDVTGGEFYRNGPALPAQGTALLLNPGASSMSHIRIVQNKVHDNNLGIEVFNPSVTASAVSDSQISDNEVYSNADDGILLYAGKNQLEGPITGFTINGNISRCNGWPANGTGFSSYCTAGYLQNGSSASTSGVGIDIIGPTAVNNTISANVTHDNYFDGISNDGGVYNTTVNVSGTSVTWVSGPVFNTNWRANESPSINSALSSIASVGSTTSLTLNASGGTLSGVSFVGPSVTNNTFTGNQSYRNTGAGFYNTEADGNTYSSNLAWLNKIPGFQAFGSSYVSYSGDAAYSNSTGGTTNQGFVSEGANNTYNGIIADDPRSSVTQNYGLLVASNAYNTTVHSASLNGPNGGLAVNDLGTNTSVDLGISHYVPDFLRASELEVNNNGCTLFSGPSTFDVSFGRNGAGIAEIGSGSCGTQDGSLALVNLYTTGYGITNVPNSSSPGTSTTGLAKITSSGAAVLTTGDTATPAWIVTGGGGTTGTAQFAIWGIAPCKMDATTTGSQGYYVVASTVSATSCHPQSAAPAAGTFQVGILWDTATTNNSVANVLVLPYLAGGGSGGSGVSSITGDGALITNNTSTGAVTLVVGAAPGHKYWGNNTDISATAAFVQPAFGDLLGSVACSQLPALTGDATSSAGSCATSIVKINGGSVPASAAVLGTNSSSQPVAATAHGVVTPLACSDSSGSGTAQSCSTSPTFSPAVGDQIIYKTTTTNTGDVTINVNAAGAVHVRKWLGSATLAAGDLAANIPELLTYDGSYWEVYTIGNAPSGSGSGIVSNCTTLGAMSYYAATGTTVSCLPSVIESTGQISLGVAGTTQGTLTFAGSTSGVVTMQPAAVAGTWTWTFPTTGGTANYFLQTNGSGVSTWAQPAFSELSGSVACSQLPALTGDATTSAGSCATTVTKVTGSFTTHGVLFGNGSSTFGVSAAGTLNQPLLSGGSSANGAYGDTPVIGTSGVYGIGASGTADTGVSRAAANVTAFGNGTAGDYSGTTKAAGAYYGPGGSGTQATCGTGSVYGCWAIGLDDHGTLVPQAGLAFLKGSYANSCILYSTNGDTPSCLPKNFNQMQGTLNLATQVSNTLPAANGGHYGPTTFATLPGCASSIEGQQAAITDSTTATWGATITGSGTNHVYGYCDGTNWTVMGK